MRNLSFFSLVNGYFSMIFFGFLLFNIYIFLNTFSSLKAISGVGLRRFIVRNFRLNVRNLRCYPQAIVRNLRCYPQAIVRGFRSLQVDI